MAHNRVPRTLYRQLLSWCRRYEDVPFDGVPPLTLTPPQVNARALQRLRSMRAFLDSNSIEDSAKHVKWCHPAHYALYKTDISVDNEMIVFPAVYNSNQLRDVIRSVFWLNNVRTLSEIDGSGDEDEQIIEPSPETVKDQISLAIDAIKSCNQLSSGELDSRRSRRKSSIGTRQKQKDCDAGAPNVKYHVGQVVFQKKKGWRGVIVGWTVEGNALTSLTTKQYTLRGKTPGNQVKDSPVATETDPFNIKYTILVDVNDATLLESSKIVSLEPQDELTVVEPCLRRIHNKLISQYFRNFCNDHFVPNDTLSYVYPLDCYSCSGLSVTDQSNQIKDHSFEQSCVSIVKGVDKICNVLVSLLVEHSQGNNFLEPLVSELSAQTKINADASVRSVYTSVSALFNFHVKVNSLLWSRKRHLEHKSKIMFSLGQIVRHKLYGYRGVVVAWDQKPFVDVSRWDGLQNVKDPQNKPFFHVIPDENDCIRAFGGTRSFRYVCQDNLETCDAAKLALDDLNPKEWRWDSDKGMYEPSEEMRFLYGEQSDSVEAEVEETLNHFQDTLSKNFLLVKEGSHGAIFTMDDLFCVLKSANTLENAMVIQDMVKEVWKECSDKVLREQLDTGISYLVAGNNEKALSVFTKITSLDPAYMEAWNKKATAHYMAGHMQESHEAAQKALEIEPRQFQALAGQGLVAMESSSSVENAMNAFKQCLALNPWSLVSARLFMCQRKLDESKESENE